MVVDLSLHSMDYKNSTPMAFLGIRFFIAFCILVLIAYFFKMPFPKNKKEFFHISIAGSLTVGTFSIGVFLSISYGISGAINALIISLQPIIVTVLALNFLKDKITIRVWIGLAFGIFRGIFL